MTEVIVWSGWIGGIAIGAYALLQWILTGNALGVSTGFGNVCGYISSAPGKGGVPLNFPVEVRLIPEQRPPA